MSLKVVIEMPGRDVVHIRWVEKDFIGLLPDGGEVVVRHFGADGVAYGFFDFVGCCLLRHAPGVI
jgi:hypothetical protein